MSEPCQRTRTNREARRERMSRGRRGRTVLRRRRRGEDEHQEWTPPAHGEGTPPAHGEGTLHRVGSGRDMWGFIDVSDFFNQAEWIWIVTWIVFEYYDLVALFFGGFGLAVFFSSLLCAPQPARPGLSLWRSWWRLPRESPTWLWHTRWWSTKNFRWNH